MRGDDRQQAKMFSYISPEERVPLDHPLRVIREMVDRTYNTSRSPSRWAGRIPLGGSCMGVAVGGRLPFCPPVHRLKPIMIRLTTPGGPAHSPSRKRGPVVTNSS
jgi:hypothetical protein